MDEGSTKAEMKAFPISFSRLRFFAVIHALGRRCIEPDADGIGFATITLNVHELN
jgi:hypothetical protein